MKTTKINYKNRLEKVCGLRGVGIRSAMCEIGIKIVYKNILSFRKWAKVGQGINRNARTRGLQIWKMFQNYQTLRERWRAT